MQGSVNRSVMGWQKRLVYSLTDANEGVFEGVNEGVNEGRVRLLNWICLNAGLRGKLNLCLTAFNLQPKTLLRSNQNTHPTRTKTVRQNTQLTVAKCPPDRCIVWS